MANINFTDTLSCTASHGRLALSTQIYDEAQSKSQATINAATAARFKSISTYQEADIHVHLGTFERSGLAEDRAKEYECSGSAGVSIMDYKVHSSSDANIRTGLILQNVGTQRTLQLLIWDNVLYYRYITFTSTARTEIDASQTTTWAPCFVNSIAYSSSTHTLKLWWNNIGVAECTLPLASSTSDGLLSSSDYKKIFSTSDASSILSRLAAVEEKLTAKE